MVKLIEQHFTFTPTCFVGGASRVDVSRMREEVKAELHNRKTVKTKAGTSAHIQEGLDAEDVASMVRSNMKEEYALLQTNISTLCESFISFQNIVISNLKDLLGYLRGKHGEDSNLINRCT